MRFWRLWLYLWLAVAVLVAGQIGWQRIQWEVAYRQIGWMVPYVQITQLARSEGWTVAALLERLKELGMRTLSIAPPDVLEWPSPRLQSSSPLSDLRSLQEAGFELVLIVDEASQVATLRKFLQAIKMFDLQRIYFAGEAIRPWQAELPQLTERLRQNQIQWGELEFSESGWASRLFAEGAHNVVRVHRISEDQLAQLTPEQALDRWMRAVIERNVRVLDVRLWPSSIWNNFEYLEALRSRLTRAGFVWAWPAAPAPFRVQTWKLILLGLGLSSLLVLITAGIFGLSWPEGGFTWLALSIAVIAGLLSKPDLARSWLATLTAIGAPLAAYLVTERVISGVKRTWQRGVSAVVTASLTSLVLGLFLAAWLSQETFFLKLDAFQGVKLALVAPLIWLLTIELTRFGWWRRPRWSDLLILSTGVLALGVIVLRSGNFSIIPIPEFEQSARSFLEAWLYARPRFKEFLIGHPLLMIWAMAGRERWGLYGPFLLVGAWIGQVSLINTFEHLHTPLLLSLWRSLNGLLLGILIGAVVWLTLRGVSRVWRSQKTNRF